MIDTNYDGAESAAWAIQPKPPAPSDTATAAPIPAQRERINVEELSRPNIPPNF